MLPSAQRPLSNSTGGHGWAEAFFSRGVLKQEGCVLLAEGLLPGGGEGARDGPSPHAHPERPWVGTLLQEGAPASTPSFFPSLSSWNRRSRPHWKDASGGREGCGQPLLR